MVKHSQKVIERQSAMVALKPQSMSIHKQMTSRTARKAPQSPSVKCLTTSASTASLGQCESERAQQLFCNVNVEEQPKFMVTTSAQPIIGQQTVIYY